MALVPLNIEHLPVALHADPARVVLRPFMPADTVLPGHSSTEHRNAVIDRILALGAREAEDALARVLGVLSKRHENAAGILDRRFIDIVDFRPDLAAAGSDIARLIGACFTEEYAFEAAALFNPCIVPHPLQAGAPHGGLRFILSLRAVGEGHVSSIVFRTGLISPDGGVSVDPAGSKPISARAERIPGASEDLPGLRLTCADGGDLGDIVLFPASQAHRGGLEDLRLIAFEDDTRARAWLGTLTGVGSNTIRQEMLRTTDFASFDLTPITGPYAATKGMALFPERVGGRYAMLGRPDHDSLWLMHSSDLYHWEDGTPVIAPAAIWESVQIGNCGSPIPLPEGWLVITHGVGPLRTYSIGACLLDRGDPSRLIARLDRPLIAPGARQWSGYVPNTVYSCGGLVHAGLLYLPYGVADSFATIARVAVKDLLSAMTPC
ncbi:MAG: glycoside hydrolase family 130 protein [Pseudomonadota bacterium]